MKSKITTPKFHTLAGLLCAGTALFLTVHVSAQNLFVAASDGNTIYQVTPAGTQTTFDTAGLDYPDGLAFDSEGDLYVENGYAGTVDEFVDTGGVLSSTPTQIASGLNDPEGIAINSAGDIFVSDHGFNSGTAISEITPGPTRSVTTFATGLSGPYSLAFDGSGDLFESDNGSGKVNEFKNNSGILSSTPTAFASGLSDIYGLAFNNIGNLFVASRTSGTIYEFTPMGSMSTFVNGPPVNNIAFDTSGNLYEAAGNFGVDAVVEFSPTGQQSTFDPGLDNPVALAFQNVTLPVPEPSTWCMFALGTAGLFIRRRKS